MAEHMAEVIELFPKRAKVVSIADVLRSKGVQVVSDLSDDDTPTPA